MRKWITICHPEISCLRKRKLDRYIANYYDIDIYGTSCTNIDTNVYTHRQRHPAVASVIDKIHGHNYFEFIWSLHENVWYCGSCFNINNISSNQCTHCKWKKKIYCDKELWYNCVASINSIILVLEIPQKQQGYTVIVAPQRKGIIDYQQFMIEYAQTYDLSSTDIKLIGIDEI